MQASVLVEPAADGVTVVTLNRPDRLNAINLDLSTRLADALDTIARDRSVRVVILTGAGRAFSAGLDLRGFGDDDLVAAEGHVGRLMSRQRELVGLCQRIRAVPQVVIAAVNGPAAGAGLALVCASDIRLAASEAIFTVAFIRAGYSACDLGVSWLLPRLVGAGRAHELMLTGRRFDSAEALRNGLLVDVVPSGELLDRARLSADAVLANPPLSVEMTKQGMWMALETPAWETSIEFENRQQVFTALTEDQPEATAAFLEKRPAHYRRR
ncbi:enoyl-CoA hydratase/isomerase family protein [Pseudofrankia inefficax]|uniref:Enoyl-CoA hydratase/isomerase n=1 Tax=Pseudofrankia inefficax (strain DSM 45817 / CECT 9037 / DDB 130130 / EuI1c) TaxID=298654 RepID=E3JAK5_PSEI1|nr:enoyl-CoA hydratase/isomerase family protein [Pseudofrankia inefficax]ADP82197.1 Enoyl-CoA hydratase/isomerase [Pseudofrankia inefficax]